jgi:hypothetical protein
LRENRRPPRGEDTGQPAARGGQRADAGKPQEAAATDAFHHFLSVWILTWILFAKSNHNYKAGRVGRIPACEPVKEIGCVMVVRVSRCALRAFLKMEESP